MKSALRASLAVCLIFALEARAESARFEQKTVTVAGDVIQAIALADSSSLPHLNLVHDLFAEGSRELLLPAPAALELHRKKGEEYERAARLEVDLESKLRKEGRSRAERATKNISMISVTLRYPAITVIDSDADGLRDIVLSLDDRIAIYRQRAETGFGAQASFARDFAVRSVDDRKEAYSSVGVSVLDLDLDGAADLVVRKNVAKGIASATATSYLFLGKKSGVYAEKPDPAAVDMLGDYDGDRRSDLVYSTDDDELSIFRGVEGGSLFSEDATEKIAVRSFGQLISVDLEERGRSDMILYYPRTGGHRSEVVILRNVQR